MRIGNCPNLEVLNLTGTKNMDDTAINNLVSGIYSNIYREEKY